MPQKITILHEGIDKLRDASVLLEKEGLLLCWLDWTQFEQQGLPKDIAKDSELYWNRIPSRPGDGDSRSLVRAGTLLKDLDDLPIRVVNGYPCYTIATSKWAQYLVFKKLGLPTPETWLLNNPQELKDFQRDGSLILKSNVGGLGKGIHPLHEGLKSIPQEKETEAFQADGKAIIQTRIEPSEPYIYRIETLGTRLLFIARTPLKENQYNYCLGDSEMEVELLPPDILPTELCDKIREVLYSIQLEIGSLEFIYSQPEGKPLFFDINSVSTFPPKIMDNPEWSPWKAIANYLKEQAYSLK